MSRKMTFDKDLDDVLKAEIQGYKTLSSPPILDEDYNIKLNFFDYRNQEFKCRITPKGEIIYVEPLGYLINNIGLDSALLNILPEPYLKGQIEAFRLDRKSKGKPCGKGWIKEGYECRVEGSLASKNKIRSVRARLKNQDPSKKTSQNTKKREISNSAKIFAGVGALALAGGGTASLIILNSNVTKTSKEVEAVNNNVAQTARNVGQTAENVRQTSRDAAKLQELQKGQQAPPTEEAGGKEGQQKPPRRPSSAPPTQGVAGEEQEKPPNQRAGAGKGFGEGVRARGKQKKPPQKSPTQKAEEKKEQEKSPDREAGATKTKGQGKTASTQEAKGEEEKQQKIGKEIEELKGKIKADKTQHKAELKQATIELNANKKEVEKLTKETEKYKQQSTQYEEELAKAKKQLTTNTKEIEKAAERESKLKQEKNNLQTDLEYTEKALEKNRKSQQEIAQKNQKLIGDLGSELDKERETSKQLAGDVSSLAKELEKSNKDLEQSQKAVQSQSSQAGQAIVEKGQIKGELATAEKQLEETKGKIQALEKNLSAAQKQIDSTQDTIDDLERTIVAYPVPKPARKSRMRAIKDKVTGAQVGMASVDPFDEKVRGGKTRSAKDVSSLEKYQKLKATPEGQKFIDESIAKSKEYAEHWNKVEFNQLGPDDTVDIDNKKKREQVVKGTSAIRETAKNIANSEPVQMAREKLVDPTLEAVGEDLINIGERPDGLKTNKVQEILEAPTKYTKKFLKENSIINEEDFAKIVANDPDKLADIFQSRTTEQVTKLINDAVLEKFGPDLYNLYKDAASNRFKYKKFMKLMDEMEIALKDETPFGRRDFFKRIRNKLVAEGMRTQGAQSQMEALGGDIIDVIAEEVNPKIIKPGKEYNAMTRRNVTLAQKLRKQIADRLIAKGEGKLSGNVSRNYKYGGSSVKVPKGYRYKQRFSLPWMPNTSDLEKVTRRTSLIKWLEYLRGR